jgi:hypothetical protein
MVPQMYKNKHEKLNKSLGPQCGGLRQVEASLTTENIHHRDHHRHQQTGVSIESVPD